MQRKIIENLFVLIISIFVVFMGSSLVDESETSVNDNDIVRVHYLSVGQGDATLISSGDYQILVDGGPDKSVLTELDNIIPFYDKKIETIILSHPHADHLIGLNYVLSRYEIERIYLSGVAHNTPEFETFITTINRKAIATEIVSSGDVLELDKGKVEFFWPEQKTKLKNDLNDSSLVFLYTFNENNLLFTGDASAEILSNIGWEIGDIDVLKVSHHGSIDGTSAALINILKPELAVIHVGNDNSFGHPSQKVLNILQGVKVLRTDLLRSITITCGKNGLTY